MKKVASSTMKLILMRTSQTFSEKELKRYENASQLAYLHLAANEKFKFFDGITKSKDHPLIKIKKLNTIIAKESLYSFSFVRHPYTRYAQQIKNNYLFQFYFNNYKYITFMYPFIQYIKTVCL